MKFFKHITTLDCIYCSRKLPMDTPDFRTINKHGWGCCSECWDMKLPGHTGVYIPPGVLQHIHANKAKIVVNAL